MSKHWKPEGDIARWTRTDGYAPPASKSWPAGATAGLALAAAGCLAVGVLFYRIAGPRHVVDENVAIDWNAVGLADKNSEE